MLKNCLPCFFLEERDEWTILNWNWNEKVETYDVYINNKWRDVGYYENWLFLLKGDLFINVNILTNYFYILTLCIYKITFMKLIL